MPKLTALLVALIAASARAECPNACSGHGTCALHDQCECCRNFGGADCSERICPFGNAHVDTPKGDVDGSTGTLSGPKKTVIVGSNVYPFGTTEQYPDLDVDEGHAYMECSNKGLCNREEGTCECFPGYDGTACQRASCPNDCSGHGTCETIKELAEDKEDGDLNTGVYGERGYADMAAGMGDLSGVGNLKYELWDKALTMGCKCDPGFTGPDCSLKLCRYGVDPLFIPSTHSYSPVLALEDDNLSPSAPMYEKAFVEIIAKDYGDSPGGAYPLKSDVSQMSGNFDLVIYDVYGEKYVLDKLKYAHFDEISAGLKSLTAFDNKGVGYGVNHTTCDEIMSYFPNNKIKDTVMGSFQNQMKHRGGLVSSAYVSGTTKPFCSVSSPHGQNITNYGWVSAVPAPVPAASVTTANELVGISKANADRISVGDRITEVGTFAGELTAAAACDGTPVVGSAPVDDGAGNTPITYKISLKKLDGTTDCGNPTGAVSGTIGVMTQASGFSGTTYTASGEMGGTFGIRYNFDYNRGNPGYHKDLYIENVIPEVGGPNGRSFKNTAPAAAPGEGSNDRAYVPVTAYYGVIQQGEVAEYKGDQAEDRPATSYDVTLPGYITDISSGCGAALAANCNKGDVITFSTDLSSYLYGLHDHGTAEASWFMPDHKTNKIKILNRYYMVATTKRILVTAKMAARSDYEIGEYDAPTNATLGRFVTQATLVDDGVLPDVYKQYWKSAGVAAGMLQTCTCLVKADAKAVATTTSDTSFFLDTTSAKDHAAIRAGMKIEAVASKIAADTLVVAGVDANGNPAADCIVNFPKTGTKVYLNKALAGDLYASTTQTTNLVFVDPTTEGGGVGGCLGCMHNLPVTHEETANAATSGYVYNGRVDFSELNKVYKAVEGTMPAIGCGSFVQQCLQHASAQTYLICASIDGVKIGQTVAGTNVDAAANSEPPRITAISTTPGLNTGANQYYYVTLDRLTGTVGASLIDITFTGGSDCKNGFDSMSNGKLMSGTDGYTPDLKLTVKAKLSQPYQYVSECSNRGACDRETGQCQCFTGYTHDNCDTQTPVC